MKYLLIVVIGLMSTNLSLAADTERKPASFYEKRFSMNFKNTPVESALQLIAEKAELRLRVGSGVNGKLNLTFKEATLEEAMERIAENMSIDYKIKDGILSVSRASRDSASAPTAGAVKAGPIDLDFSYRSINIKYSTARDLTTTLTKNLREGETITPDDANNTLILYSSEETFKKVQEFIVLVDRRPMQILIEAQIVETTKNFARDIGISWGDLGASGAAAPTSGIINPAPSNPNFVFKSLLGNINDRSLEFNLQAAETRGDAKVISRPKVFTLNNKKATIHSGITYNIRTLTTVTAGTSGTSGTAGGSSGAAGGLKEISSGLQLDVTPTIVGDGLVRLALKVSNSEPNAGSAVDGIPGINDNSADTSILVKGGQTATIAGLLKNSVSKTEQGVPWLSKLPVLGWLFSSHSDRDTTSEMMIFITPHVVDAIGEEKSAKSEEKIDKKEK